MTPWLHELMLSPVQPMVDFLGIPLGYPVLMRGVGAFAIAFFFVFLLGRRTAAFLYRKKLRDRVRDYDEFFSKSKSGTPTMGGLLIVGGITAAALLFNDLRSSTACLLLLTPLFYGAVGAVDDYMKVRGGSSEAGLSRSLKFLAQIAFAVLVAFVVSVDSLSPFPPELRSALALPFPGPSHFGPIDLGVFYPLFVVIVIVSIANAINFADGLDGLAVLPCAMTAAVFGFFAYLAWNVFSARNFDLMPLLEMQEVAVFCSAIVGACFGFLWFNGYPAQMIMGDTGSQALGGSLGVIAVVAKLELLFLIAGGVFVFEAFSVLWQDYVGIRWLGRRYFLRAPAHHSFQHRGVAETKVVLRFWIISLLCCVLSVATLKLR